MALELDFHRFDSVKNKFYSLIFVLLHNIIDRLRGNLS